MAGFIHESALAVEGLVQPVEHPVERLGEALELVAGLRHGKPPGRFARRDRRGLRSKLLDGAERRAGEDPSQDGEREEQYGTSDRDQRRQPGDGLLLILHVHTDEEDSALDRGREDPSRDTFLERGDPVVEEPRAAQTIRHGGREQRLPEPGARREGSVGSDVLREHLVRRRHGGHGSRRIVPHGQGERPQPFVDRAPQLCPEAHEERGGGRGEDHERQAREDEREPRADREPHHDSFRRRYPTPRTVSIDRRPNGRSTFSRRYRT